MSQNSSSDYVPSAKQGTADSLAAPGCVGAGGTICKLCGYAHTAAICPTDDQVVSWYDGQSDAFLVDLQDQRNAWTPREAWNAFFMDAVAVRPSNEAAWMSVAAFLARQNLIHVLKERARSGAHSAAGGASATSGAQGAARTLPVGNHGEIVAMGVSL